jgi:hypothetical protein
MNSNQFNPKRDTCIYFLHDKPAMLNEHFPSVIALVAVDNLRFSINKGTADVTDSSHLQHIRDAERTLISAVIPDLTPIAPTSTNRSISFGKVPDHVVTKKGAIYKIRLDNLDLTQCTLQLIGRLTNVWGYTSSDGQHNSGITWDVDRVFIESDPSDKVLPA